MSGGGAEYDRGGGPQAPTCEFKAGEGEGIGVDGETLQDNGVLICESEADDVLRPKGGWHLREYGARVPFCRRHAAYLTDDAPANWEMLSFGDLSPLTRGEDNGE